MGVITGAMWRYYHVGMLIPEREELYAARAIEERNNKRAARSASVKATFGAMDPTVASQIEGVASALPADTQAQRLARSTFRDVSFALSSDPKAQQKLLQSVQNAKGSDAVMRLVGETVKANASNKDFAANMNLLKAQLERRMADKKTDREAVRNSAEFRRLQTAFGL